MVEFRRDSGGEERGIESCEAVSASSSSDSRDTFRGPEPVGEGGGRILEAMTDEIEGNSLSPGNYVIAGSSPGAMPIIIII